LLLLLSLLAPRAPAPTLFPYTTLFRSIGALPNSLPAPTLPGADWAMTQSLLVPALAVAALAAIESLLSARVAAGMADTGPYQPRSEEHTSELQSRFELV